MPTSPIILSVSDLNQHHTCPTALYARYHTRRWSRPSAALTTGKVLHQLLEARYAPGLPPDRLDSLLSDPTLDPGARTLFSQIPGDWTPPYAITAAEQPLFLELSASFLPPAWSGPRVYIAGTPDATTTRATDSGIINGSGQYKSVALGRSPEALVDSIVYGAHELLYSLLRLANRIPATEELHILIFRKLTLAAQRDGTPAFLHHQRATPHLASRGSVVQLFQRDILPSIWAALDTLTRPLPATRRDFGSCMGPFYNSPCPLYTTCRQLSNAPTLAGIGELLPEPAPCRYTTVLEAQLAAGQEIPLLA